MTRHSRRSRPNVCMSDTLGGRRRQRILAHVGSIRGCLWSNSTGRGDVGSGSKSAKSTVPPDVSGATKP
eukprot:7321357-Pyramimonas_sp.AAC.1